MDDVKIVSEHYKETNNLRLAAQTRRNKSFVILCILEALSFLVLIRPEQAFSSLLNGINAVLETSLELGNNILQTLLWTMIVYILIRYVQDMLYIERQYTYQSELEQYLSGHIGTDLYRESKNYSQDYPMVLNLIDLFYKMFCPILFACINFIHIRQEWKLQPARLALVIDTLMCFTSIVILWFYFFEIHDKITGWCKRYIPFVNRLAIFLREALKHV